MEIFVLSVMKNSRKYTKQEQFNRIKKVIESSKSNLMYLPTIDRMIENFRSQFGKCNLSNSLLNLKAEFYEANI